MINTYRKKPVEIQAVKLEMPTTPQEIASWCGGNICGVGAVGENVWIEIPTLEGTMKAQYGDYIIKGVEGDFLILDKKSFESYYEPIVN